MTGITRSDSTHLTRWITAGPLSLGLLSNMKGKEKQCINWWWRTSFFLMVSRQNFWAQAISQIMASICVHITFFHVTRKCNFSLETYSLRKQTLSPHHRSLCTPFISETQYNHFRSLEEPQILWKLPQQRCSLVLLPNATYQIRSTQYFKVICNAITIRDHNRVESYSRKHKKIKGTNDYQK